MKICICILISICLPVFADAQHYPIDTSNKLIEQQVGFNSDGILLPAVKKIPAYEGGKKAWQDFLRSNIDIKVPFSNRALPGKYNVIIKFIVGSDGKLYNIGAVSNCGKGMEAEVIRCIKKSKPWEPAEMASGKKLGYTLNTMVIFIVSTNDVSLQFN